MFISDEPLSADCKKLGQIYPLVFLPLKTVFPIAICLLKLGEIKIEPPYLFFMHLDLNNKSLHISVEWSDSDSLYISGETEL